MIHLHENQNLLSSLDLAIGMFFFSPWIFSQMMRHERPNIWVVQTAVQVCKPRPAAPNSPHMHRESRQEEQQAESLLEQGGSMRAELSPAEPSPALPGAAWHAMWTSWWGGLAHRTRAAGGKGLHGTSSPLWDSSPGHPVGSMQNASSYQHSMPLRPSSSFKFP